MSIDIFIKIGIRVHFFVTYVIGIYHVSKRLFVTYQRPISIHIHVNAYGSLGHWYVKNNATSQLTNVLCTNVPSTQWNDSIYYGAVFIVIPTYNLYPLHV